jgi:hypothetical protein
MLPPGRARLETKARADRIVRDREDNWDGRCCLLCGEEYAPGCEDDIDFEPDELGRYFGSALVASLSPTVFNKDGATFVPAKLTKPMRERRRPVAPG